MSERILIEDVISNVRHEDEGYHGTLQKTLQDYINALNDYSSDYSKVKVKLVGLDYYTTDEINNLNITNNSVSFMFTFYDKGVGMGAYQVSINSSSGTIYIGDGNLESGWTLKLYIEEDEPEPGPEPTPTPDKPGYLNSKLPLERIADALEDNTQQDEGYLATKTYLERIAISLEEQVMNADTKKANYLDSQTYLERIAKAVEAGAGKGGGVTPTGTIEITENGTHDVTNYANADVNVSGGGMTETLLWENPDPTQPWGDQTQSTSLPSIQLSETYANYEYIKLVYSASTFTGAKRYEVIAPVYPVGVSRKNMPSLGMLSDPYARGLYRYKSDLKYNVYPAMSLSNSNVNNNYCIPLAIYGVSKKGS